MARAISIDRREPESQSCPAPARRSALDTIASGTFTAVVSAALFSLFFFADGMLAWLGALGFLPLALRALGCPTCGGGRAPSGSVHCA
jgi:hypothetical protein